MVSFLTQKINLVAKNGKQRLRCQPPTGRDPNFKRRYLVGDLEIDAQCRKGIERADSPLARATNPNLLQHAKTIPIGCKLPVIQAHRRFDQATSKKLERHRH
jgi:hypothetical protein